jgi:hypothetical protein
MVAAGTLAVFAVVALALIWHRYVDPKVGLCVQKARRKRALRAVVAE